MAEHSPPVPFLDSTGKPLPKLPKVIRPGTCAAVFNERGEILLQRRADNGFWSMPGGAIDPGESVEQGALREVWEETGLQVRMVRLVGVYSDPRNYMITHYPGGDIVHNVSLCFVCERVAGTLQLSDESTDIGYFPVEALPEPMMPSHLIRLKDVLAQRPEPFIR
jgi:ADP-ribose pyrophosphatase YjhB (NUDIX family)